MIDEQTKRALAPEETNALQPTDNSITSDIRCQDNIECETYQDKTEADPVRPEDWKIQRGKFWCFVLYPESAPSNWIEILNMSGVKWAVSPLHDKDINPDGTSKKEHYHVILVWTADTTYNNVMTFTHTTLKSTVPQKLMSPVGYYRYFTHADNPEKVQYSENDIVYGNGFDISEYKKRTREQQLELHKQLSAMVREQGITSYAYLTELADQMGLDEYEMVVSHTMHFTALCKSVRYEQVKGETSYES